MSLRDLPGVEKLLQTDSAVRMEALFGRTLTLQAVRAQLDAARLIVRQGGTTPNSEEILAQAEAMLEDWLSPTLQPVINATGVIIHTNLGRAPLSEAARQAMLDAAEHYGTLEYDLAKGKRGKRNVHCEGLLQKLTGAEAGLVVNNNAAAVLLALTGLARRRQVLVSRSQLIEIGGGFRIPDVMKQSGAKLVEVGTTNRTHLSDYEAALGDRTALILRAHHSNFRLVGFTTEPGLKELTDLGKRYDVPVLDDLGSGALLDTETYGLGHEPTVQESLDAGASLVAFSGDKLLGGPQAGILLGEERLIDRLRKHPLARAVRPDKLCLAALSATLLHYLKDEATQAVPIWRMIAASPEDLRVRASDWAQQLRQGDVIEARSTVGGGSLPEETLPTWALALSVSKPNALAARLRKARPAIIARVAEDKVVLDPRTVLPDQEAMLLKILQAML
ncbi:MAG TPA: L-seryl-tRNA(Sec) selenium transferase [Anaerolineae bacterium]|nr:L-seryl-tRNA(Sec) selenium transferase [Anaerolineae bacterium]